MVVRKRTGKACGKKNRILSELNRRAIFLDEIRIVSSRTISKLEKEKDIMRIKRLREPAAKGTHAAALRSRLVSDVRVYVKNGNLVREQDNSIVILRQLETTKMKVGTKFYLKKKG